METNWDEQFANVREHVVAFITEHPNCRLDAIVDDVQSKLQLDSSIYIAGVVVKLADIRVIGRKYDNEHKHVYYLQDKCH